MLYCTNKVISKETNLLGWIGIFFKLQLGENTKMCWIRCGIYRGLVVCHVVLCHQFSTPFILTTNNLFYNPCYTLNTTKKKTTSFVLVSHISFIFIDGLFESRQKKRHPNKRLLIMINLNSKDKS